MNQTNADAVALAADRARAIALRSSGATLEQVAKMITLPNGKQRWSSASNVRRAIRAVIDSYVKPEVDEMIHLQESQLDQMTLAIWPRVKKGELGAIDRLIKIQERRARLFGLDAPKRVSIESGKPVEQDYQLRLAHVLRTVLAHVPDPEARKAIAQAMVIDEPRPITPGNE